MKLDLVKTTLTIILIVFLTHRYDITGTALALLIGLAPALVIVLGFLKKTIGLQYRTFIGTIIVPALASIFMLLPLMIWKEDILNLPLLILLSFLSLLGILYMLLIIAIGKKLNIGPYKTLKIILHHVSPV